MAHYLIPLLEDQIRIQASNMRRFYLWCFLLFVAGMIATWVLFRLNAGTEILRAGPVIITTAINGIQFVYMSPGRERLSGFKQARSMLDAGEISHEHAEEVEKIVLDAFRDILKRSSK